MLNVLLIDSLIPILRFALVLVLAACSQAHSHHHHNRSQNNSNHAANVLGIVSGALGLVRDTAAGGARVVANNPATREVISTAVDGVKEVAEIATDPRPIFPGKLSEFFNILNRFKFNQYNILI
jgi:hypothetical protein